MHVRAHILWFALAVAPACGKKSEPSPELSPVPIAESAAFAHVAVGEHGFLPTSLALPKGAAGSTVAVTFVRTTDETCAKEVVFPDLGIKKDLPLNKPVTVDVPTDAARTLTFQCGMAMYKGALVVR
ncbi:MAG TPA: cupredoxin domain-containing protein [Polyangiaceae bacterium]|nr:cupredoxin domain-containing protein [Polyangiaceae bacterium]